MQTRVSGKGQVVLPGPIRRKLGLRPGDSLDASVKDGNIILAPRRPRRAKGAIRRDAVTGLPVLSAGPGAAPLTGEQVQDILSDLRETSSGVNALVALVSQHESQTIRKGSRYVHERIPTAFVIPD